MPVDDLVLDPMRWMGPTVLTLFSNLFIILFFSLDNHVHLFYCCGGRETGNVYVLCFWRENGRAVVEDEK